MKIPTVQESPEAFIARVAALLLRPDTHVYFDTNVLMWVTLMAPEARSEFLKLLKSINAATHVPTWAMNEFYRMHRDSYLEKQLKLAAETLNKSITAFSSEIRRYMGQSPLDDTTVVERLSCMRRHGEAFKDIVRAWNYEAPGRQTVEWMNTIACAGNVDFNLLAELKRIGVARYSHEVPPGYEDDHKKKRKNRANNRFGDLLFWQEVLAHAKAAGAKTVIIMTNDRKPDWYFDQGRPEISPKLRRLGVHEWKPVPRPHPLLTYEMHDHSGAELVLVDQLYLGGIAWELDKKNLPRLVGAALDIPVENIERVDAPPPAVQMRTGGTINLRRAMDLLRDAFAAPSALVAEFLANLDAGAVEAEEHAASFDQTKVEALSETDAVLLARYVGQKAIAGHPHAGIAAKNLLELIPELAPDHAACVHLGLAVSSYYDGDKPRNIPYGAWLPGLADCLGHEAVRPTVTVLRRRLVNSSSPALYLLDNDNPLCKIELTVDTRRDQDPAELATARIGDRSVLTKDSLQGPALRALVGEEASVEQIVAALCAHYAIPLRNVRFVDEDQHRSIPADLHLVRIDRVDVMVEVAQAQASAASPDGFEGVDSGLDEEELVDDEDFEFEDEDELEAGDEGEGDDSIG